MRHRISGIVPMVAAISRTSMQRRPEPMITVSSPGDT
jgi:hypothetical protein